MKKLFTILVLFMIMSITMSAQVYTTHASIYEFRNNQRLELYSESVKIPVYLDLELKVGYYGNIKTYIQNGVLETINFKVTKIYNIKGDITVDVIPYGSNYFNEITFIFDKDFMLIVFETDRRNNITWLVYRL